MRPSSKIGSTIARPTGPVLPGLNFGVNSANADEFKDSVDTFSSPELKQTISKIYAHYEWGKKVIIFAFNNSI